MGLLKKTFLCTLATIAFISCTKNIHIPFPLKLCTLILPLFPLIIHFLNSTTTTNLPPGPKPLPLFGNWLQVGNDLNHRLLAAMSKTYGPVFLLKLGSKHLVVVSHPELATKSYTHKEWSSAPARETSCSTYSRATARTWSSRSTASIGARCAVS